MIASASKVGDLWSFDTEAGEQQMIDRRIAPMPFGSSRRTPIGWLATSEASASARLIRSRAEEIQPWRFQNSPD